MEKGAIQKLDPVDDVEEENLLQRMGEGERETILAFLKGKGDFIVIDDKKGAGFLRSAHD